MSWNPNQGQYPNQEGQYSNPTPPPMNDPYGAQQGGYQQGGYQQQGQYPPPPAYGQQYGGYQQPPNYGQQQYGGFQQPFGEPMGSSADALGPTSMGMQANVAAGLSYVLGWITGLIFFFGEKQNRFVRFNAMQSILLYAALTVVYIVIDVLSTAFLFSGLFTLFVVLTWLVGLGALALWIILMVNAFQGKYLKLPVIGDYAEKYANPTMR
jgi:uncharacterized membrane protein